MSKKAENKAELVGIERLKLMRDPFPPNLVSKLPKPTKWQTQAVRENAKAGVVCNVCGAFHHPSVVHLDYVGHAALTDRLLDVDPAWNWEPVNGTPEIDHLGGMWIKLTLCGITRLGYGHSEKRSGDATKEVIGDALRNAAMRFGAALDLWHKGDLYAHHTDELLAAMRQDQDQDQPSRQADKGPPPHSELLAVIADGVETSICEYWRGLDQDQQQREWSKVDKETQKYLKKLLIEHPAPILSEAI